MINGLFESQLNPEEADRLAAALKDSQEHRQRYLQFVDTHASLAWQQRWPLPIKAVFDASEIDDLELAGLDECELEMGEQDRIEITPVGISRHWIGTASMVLSAVVVSVVLTWWVAGRAKTPRVVSGSAASNSITLGTPAEEARSPRIVSVAMETPVARVGSSVDAIWTGNAEPATGDVVRKGWFELDSGIARLDFFSGVRMVVQGPARIELVSAWEVNLDWGSVRCEVGEFGKGFRIQSRGMDVVDLGTEFGMRVGVTGEPEVHVFSGKVALIDEGGNTQFEIAEQEAMQLSRGALVSTPYSETGFTSVDEVARRSNLARDSKRLAWRSAADQISRDPATVIHYTMTNQRRDDLRIVNQAANAAPATHAVVIGCGLIDGRRPEKQAIQYQGNGDRLLLAVDEPQDSVTAMIWVRIDNHDQELMGLLMGEEPNRRWLAKSIAGRSATQPELDNFRSSPIRLTRWGIWGSGAMHLAQRRGDSGKPTSPWNQYSSEPNSVLRPSRQWNHIAFTYDGPNERGRQYVNGHPIQSWDTGYGDSLRLGNLAIGNLTVDEREIALGVDREFFGAIDEVVISSRVYALGEIQAYYEVGKP